MRSSVDGAEAKTKSAMDLAWDESQARQKAHAEISQALSGESEARELQRASERVANDALAEAAEMRDQVILFSEAHISKERIGSVRMNAKSLTSEIRHVVPSVKVEKEVTFKASFDEVLKVFQDNKDEIKKIDNTKIVWRREDKVRMELTTPQGLVTYFILQERKGLDEEKKEAFFQSTIIETDGFITKQDTLTVLTEKDGKAVIKMNIHVVCPEIPAIFLRIEVKRQAQSVIRKIKKLLNED